MEREIEETLEQEKLEAYEEPDLNISLFENEGSDFRAGSLTSSDASMESESGDIGGSSQCCLNSSSGASTSTSSGFPEARTFNRTPGPRRPQIKIDSGGDRTNKRKWGPIGIDESKQRPLPISRAGYWSPWDGCHWTPFKKYPWLPLDRSPFSLTLDANNNSYYSRNYMASYPHRFDNYWHASQCSELSSSASTLETSWTSTEEEAVEEAEPFPKVPPIGPYWLVGYLKSRGILVPPEVSKRMQSWQLVRDAIYQFSLQPLITPCNDVDDIDKKSKEKDEEE